MEEREKQLEQQEAFKALMIFSIGPVQEFIAQARRTRDLWFGSHLLSELSKVVAITIDEQHGELISPYFDKDILADKQKLAELKVANKIYAIVETNDPKQIAQTVRKAITKKWREYTEQAKSELQGWINEGAWDRQIKDVIEFYAAWSRLDSDNEYRLVRERTEQLLSARKALRDFKQNEPGRLFGEQKSSLDAGRESVLWMDRYEEFRKKGIKKNETMDAISLVKRLSIQITEGSYSFPSVCETVFKSFQKKVHTNPECKVEVDRYYSSLRQRLSSILKLDGDSIDSYDSRLFYESRIDDYVNEHAARNTTEEQRTEIIKSIKVDLQNLYDRLSTIGVQFTPYYAFIQCDGDGMGDLVRSFATSSEHQNFSKHLSQFASEAKQIVKACEGELIYSGGDDIMAYVPLHRCLEVSNELRKRFAEILQNAVPKDKKAPTLSVGLAIVHMRERLEEVRELARNAEKMAKARKDELAVFFQKRSGGDLMRISLPFSTDPVNNIQKLIGLFRQGVLSSQFAYGLRDLYMKYEQMLGPKKWKITDSELHILIWQEIERSLKKKSPELLTSSMDENLAVEALPLLRGMYESVNQSEEDRLLPLKLLAEQLIIAVTLEKAGYETDANIENTTS
ncbi:type III-B CRISPR-associated protein Cas10/Cmr2 [Paenibacillus aceti]|uniref:Type III-B CRISPR-associated protein Cas10/Cmr2 n=1 Tax=Paenibacillus aceti TaxID=1820010 RepID=A0ABQ1W9U1_9BACL|nr:type III-B CRISPR-associated protein Cas10/Cmr2 [Paenibacillus aceti]GGG19989.1 type III-B CRISPR-associated protein Cas10/Cmr2 [Paenibacillus aceti]